MVKKEQKQKQKAKQIAYTVFKIEIRVYLAFLVCGMWLLGEREMLVRVYFLTALVQLTTKWRLEREGQI